MTNTDMKPSERMRVHVLELSALAGRMGSGEAKERIEARVGAAKTAYDELKAKEDHDEHV